MCICCSSTDQLCPEHRPAPAVGADGRSYRIATTPHRDSVEGLRARVEALEILYLELSGRQRLYRPRKPTTTTTTRPKGAQ